MSGKRVVQEVLWSLSLVRIMAQANSRYTASMTYEWAICSAASKATFFGSVPIYSLFIRLAFWSLF